MKNLIVKRKGRLVRMDLLFGAFLHSLLTRDLVKSHKFKANIPNVTYCTRISGSVNEVVRLYLMAVH